MVLFGLAVLWAVVLLPPWLRTHREGGRDSIVSFRRQLSVLERTTPDGTTTTLRPLPDRPTPPWFDLDRRMSLAEARQRRRTVLEGLALTAGITLIGALLSSSLLYLHLFVDVLLAGYVVMLVQARKAAEERQAKVTYLPTAHGSPEPAFLLRRSAQ